MSGEIVVAVVSVAVSGTATVAVPWLTFRYSLRKDRAAWLRDRRAAVYIDLLVEATATCYWAVAQATAALAGAIDPSDPQHRPGDQDLIARMSAYASREVIALFDDVVSGWWPSKLGAVPSPEERYVAVSRAYDALEARIRWEMEREHTG